jgi:hypothetical protein
MPKKTDQETIQCSLMPSQAPDLRIRGNYRLGLVADCLKLMIHKGSKRSIVSAYFNDKTYDHDHKSHHAVFQAL